MFDTLQKTRQLFIRDTLFDANHREKYGTIQTTQVCRGAFRHDILLAFHSVVK